MPYLILVLVSLILFFSKITLLNHLSAGLNSISSAVSVFFHTFIFQNLQNVPPPKQEENNQTNKQIKPAFYIPCTEKKVRKKKNLQQNNNYVIPLCLGLKFEEIWQNQSMSDEPNSLLR